MGTMTKEKLRNLTIQGLIFKTVGAYNEHSCRVAIIY